MLKLKHTQQYFDILLSIYRHVFFQINQLIWIVLVIAMLQFALQSVQ